MSGLTGRTAQGRQQHHSTLDRYLLEAIEQSPKHPPKPPYKPKPRYSVSAAVVARKPRYSASASFPS
jgi:hypothetical protein